MIIVRLLVTAVVGIVLAVPAASSDPHPRTVNDLVAAIAATGLACGDFQPAAPPLEASEGSCTVGHEFGVALDVLSSHATLVKQMPKALKAVCSELKQAKSSVKLVFVVGSNWVATFESTVNARPLAKALSGKVQPLKCS
jgi:hypothetical protein